MDGQLLELNTRATSSSQLTFAQNVNATKSFSTLPCSHTPCVMRDEYGDAAIMHAVQTSDDRASTPPATSMQYSSAVNAMLASARKTLRWFQPSESPPAIQFPSPPLPPPPPSPLVSVGLPPPMPHYDWQLPSQGVRDHRGSVWAYSRIGFVPTALLMLFALFFGLQIGRSVYYLLRLLCGKRKKHAGFKNLP
jgi:hypothetical protein